MSEFRLFSPPIRVFFIENPDGIMVLGISDKDGQSREIQKCVERKEICAQRAGKKYLYQPPVPQPKFRGLKDLHS